MTSDTKTREILEYSVEALKAHWLLRKRRLASLRQPSSPRLADGLERVTKYSSSAFAWICVWIVVLSVLHMFQVTPHFLPVLLSFTRFQLHCACMYAYLSITAGPDGIRVSHDLAEDVTFHVFVHLIWGLFSWSARREDRQGWRRLSSVKIEIWRFL